MTGAPALALLATLLSGGWAAAQPVPRILGEAKLDPRAGLNFAATLWPSTVYVGQQATYEIGIFLSEETRARLRSNPQFVPPDVQSALAIDLPVPAGPLRRSDGDRNWDVHVFSRALFPLAAGRNPIAPARLTWSVPLGNSYFSREETHSARSQALTLIVREPPEAGRPPDYQGAVGQLGLSARVDAPRTRVGEPVIMTLTVSGIGNIALFPRPVVSVPWGQTVAGAERVHIDSTSYLVRGRKEFEFVVTPRQQGTVTTPSVRYPYFNPYTEKYEIALAQGIPLVVTGGSLAASGTEPASDEQKLSIRRQLRGPVPPPPTEAREFWAVFMLAPLPAVVILMRRRRTRKRPDEASARLHSLAAASPPAGPRDIRRAFADALDRRLGPGGGSFGDPARLERNLRRSGVSLEVSREVALLAHALNEAAFSQVQEGREDLAIKASRAFQRVDDEAKRSSPHQPRGSGTGGSGSGHARRSLALFIGTTATLSAAAAAAAAASRDDDAIFRSGIAAYEAGAFADARDLFLSVTRGAPRAADAWANAGTAAWHADDTASAVLGWQKALRLEPMSRDVRVRLASSPGLTGGFPGEIPPISAGIVAGTGLLIWLTGFGLVAWSIRGRARSPTRVSLAAVAGGGAIVLAALSLQQRIDGNDRVVVVDGDRLRESPAFASSGPVVHGAGIVSGESAVARSREGGWTRIRFDDGRQGWVESRKVRSLSVKTD
ncbi:MAG: hypothetical protein ACT4OZ_09395 [Gemmatimonadota bacterium]